MSKKCTTYSAEFKSRLVLELLKNARPISEKASAQYQPSKLTGLEKDILRILKYLS